MTETPDDRRATIIGAGITGLSAAHELVERGFRVVVYEAAEATGPFRHEAVDVGGMAATQWSVPRPARKDDEPSSTRPPFFVDTEIWFEPNTDDLSDEAKSALDGLREILRQNPGFHLRVIGFVDESDEGQDGLARRRAKAVAEVLANKDSKLEERLHVEDGDFAPMTTRRGRPRRPEKRRVVLFRVIQDLVPGEHGFRFFPAFYVHLFDVMRRTQILDERIRGGARRARRMGTPTRETVYDRLRATDRQEVRRAPSARGHFVWPRRPLRSFHEALRLGREVMETLGVPTADAARVHLKLFQFLTSCEERRAQTAELSWSEYLGAEPDSPLAKYLDMASSLLIALKAKDADAQTHGTITVQMLMDQLREDERTDSVLVGPTTLEWLHPWRKYLELQGVKFEHATVSRV
ncbi:MAG: FAD-dependent oxidoreductase, partial [Sandaracinaceae bacterium]